MLPLSFGFLEAALEKRRMTRRAYQTHQKSLKTKLQNIRGNPGSFAFSTDANLPGAATRLQGADFGAPHFDFFPDFVPDFSHAGHFFFMRANQGGGIAKTPVKTFGDAGKDRATLGAGFIANGNDMAEEFARFEDVEDRSRFFVRNVDADFLHRLDDERIQSAGLQSRAFGGE